MTAPAIPNVSRLRPYPEDSYKQYRYCSCGRVFTASTRGAVVELCPACQREQDAPIPERKETKRALLWEVLNNPSDAPFSRDAAFPTLEVASMLHLGAFEPGTVLAFQGVMYTVIFWKNVYYIEDAAGVLYHVYPNGILRAHRQKKGG